MHEGADECLYDRLTEFTGKGLERIVKVLFVNGIPDQYGCDTCLT